MHRRVRYTAIANFNKQTKPLNPETTLGLNRRFIRVGVIIFITHTHTRETD